MTMLSTTRTRWAAIGAALTIAVGGGGLGMAAATATQRATYQAIVPCRLIDTRLAPFTVGPRTAPLGPGETFSASGWGAAGDCELPSGTTALAINATALNATQPTFLTFFPGGAELPTSSNLNPVPGQPPTPNAVNVTLAADGGFSVYNLQGTVDLIIDVVGVYSDHHHDDRYYTRAEIDAMVVPTSGSIAIDGYTAFLTPSFETERIVENNYCVRATPRDVGGGLLNAGGLWAGVPVSAGAVVKSITVHSDAATPQPFTISLSTATPDGPGRSLVSSATVRTAGPGATSVTIDVTDQTPLGQGERLRLYFHGWTASATASLCSVTLHYS